AALAAQQRALQAFQQQNQQAAVKLFTYRLKHASATQLAPVLTNLFTGAAGFGFATGPGGIQFINPQTGAVGNIQFNPQTGGVQLGRGAAVPPNNVNPGRGGFGNNGAANPVNPNVNPLAANQAALAAAPGALSGQAGQIRIVAEESSNSLLVRATDSDWALIQQIVQGIDLRPLQVLIEVTIAEVTRTHDLNVGVTGSITRKKSNGIDSIGVQPGAASTSNVN